MVSPRLYIEMIHLSRLQHNLVRWLVAWLYQQHHSPSRQLRDLSSARALFNNFVSDFPITDLDMSSYVDNFTLLASASSIVEAELKANLICSSLVRWADGKQLAIAPLKSSVTLFTSDTHQFWLNRKCESETMWPHWTEPLKSWVSRWTPTSPWPSRPRLCWTSHKRPQLHESLSWVELWLHYWNIGGHIQGNCAPHHELL